MARTICITGASAGFGRAIAAWFAERGERLLLLARRRERLDEFVRTFGDRAPIHAAVLDVRDRRGVEELFRTLPPPFSGIDILINNAGLALGLEPAHEASLDEWETMVDTNVKGMMYVTRHVLPGMVARKRGLVVNIGSTAGRWPYPGGNVYGGTKAFVEQFSRNLRADLAGTGVRVTCLAPGMAETEFSLVRFRGDEGKASSVYQGTDPITADDIAAMVGWLADLPPHLNVNFLEVMPTCQTWGHFVVDRKG